MATKETGRLIGIDLARFVAIVGMMAAHLLHYSAGASWIGVVTSGFPSTLFAVLGGFGIAFASRRYWRMGYWAGVAALVARGVVVLAIGLLMNLLPPHSIAVILVYFGTAIIVTAFIWRVRTSLLIGLATVLALVGPQILPMIRAADPHQMTGRLDLSSLDAAFFSVLFRGTYPVVTWVVYLLVGMVLARAVVEARELGHLGRTALVMAGGGVLVGGGAWVFDSWYRVSVVLPRLMQQYSLPQEKVAEWLAQPHYGGPDFAGWDALLLASPHTGATMDILRTGGVAVAIIGIFVAATYRLRAVPLVLRPLVSAGSASLTVYTFHVSAVAVSVALADGSVFWWVWGPGALAWQVSVVLLFGSVLAFMGRRGPLEALTSAVSKRCGELGGRTTDSSEIQTV